MKAGCVVTVAWLAGVISVGATDCFWKSCAAAELTGSPTAPAPLACVAGRTAQ